MSIFKNFEIVGHRGAMGYAPENTIVSFQKALDVGASTVEFDLHVAADGEIVVIHDEAVDRTTNGKGLVRNLTYNALSRLDAGSWFVPPFGGCRIPLFAHVLELLAKNKAKAMIEIKSGLAWRDSTHLNNVLKLIKAFNMLEYSEIISFDHAIIERLKQLEPKVMIGMLSEELPDKLIERAKAMGAEVLHPCPPVESDLTDAGIEKAQEQGLMVLATANTEREIRRLLAMGVDGICADYPDRIVRALALKRNN